MLLVVLLWFNWWAGVSPTGPTVHFYVRHIKERANGGREDGDRCEESRSWSDPADQARCLHPLSSFTVSPLPFTLFLSGSFSHSPAFTSSASSFHPTVSALFHAAYIRLPLSFLSLSLCMILGGFHSPIKKHYFLTFFPFIYVLYITSHSFIHWYRGWRPSFKGMCVPYIGQPLLIGTMQWLVFINKSSYTELKLACLQESCKL